MLTTALRRVARLLGGPARVLINVLSANYFWRTEKRLAALETRIASNGRQSRGTVADRIAGDAYNREQRDKVERFRAASRKEQS